MGLLKILGLVKNLLQEPKEDIRERLKRNRNREFALIIWANNTIQNKNLFFVLLWDDTISSLNSEASILRSDHRKAASPEKEDRYYTTRGSAVGLVDENGKIAVDSNNGEDNKGVVWPKLYITLSSKEKEEDFMAMKGCKPPQRPKKRAKIIQRSLLLVSPGAWLTDMCQERYEVREKKSSKKRPRGLKAMGNMESDSD
uniref:Uncharacterized protein n=1 Tax=Gossypium raimondii TaxID=29730 RepID=A0A0D2SK80_GOSRA|nr:hypothetical protein B456_007G262500 [Gossypium raimondii]